LSEGLGEDYKTAALPIELRQPVGDRMSPHRVAQYQ